MRIIMIILLLLQFCSSVEHKPVEIAQLQKVIEDVKEDKTLSPEKKAYYSDKFESAQSTIASQATYIIQIETDKANLQKEKEDLKVSQKKETDELKNKITSLSESAGRIKQVDFQFWGLIGIAILFLIGMVLFIIIKYGKSFTPAGASSGIAEGLLKEAIKE